MSASVGIRALQQNASAVVSRAEHGETVEITDRGRLVARLVPILGGSRVDQLRSEGLVRNALRPLYPIELPPPAPTGTPSLSSVLADMRADER